MRRAQMARPMARPLTVIRAESTPFGQMFVRSPARPVVEELRRLVQDTNRGRNTTPVQKNAILKCVDKLQTYGEGKKTTGLDSTATWQMLWTTEKVVTHDG